MSRRTVFAAAGAALVSSPATVSAQTPTRFEIPFRLVDNQPLTQVHLNRRGPYWFLIDTGASSFCLDHALCEQLRLEFVGAGESQGAVGRVPVGVYRARDMILANRLRDRNVEVIGVAGLAAGSRFQGLYPMARGIAETGFDFDQRVFIVNTRPEGEAHPGFDRLQARVDVYAGGASHPSPRVSVEIEGRTATLVLDTGANGGLFLKPDFVRRHRLWEANPRYVDGASVGIAGAFRTRQTTASDVRLGRYRFRDLPIRLGHPEDSGRDGYGSHDGLLGMEVLRRLNFYLRPRRDELWIKPNTHIDDVYRYNRSGLELVWTDGQVRVVSVASGSPADQAGLRAGDVITAASAGEGTLDGLSWALTDAPGAVIGMSVMRSGEASRDVTVTLAEPYAGEPAD